MPKPNPTDPLYQCAVAYKKMSDTSYHDKYTNVTGRDVKYEIEMVTSDFKERAIEGLQGIRTYTVAFREPEFQHLTGRQHFVGLPSAKKSEKFLNDCLDGTKSISDFAGYVYDAEHNEYGFEDRIKTLENFEMFMDNIPNYFGKSDSGIFTIKTNKTNIGADYVIQFKDNISPINKAIIVPVSYTSFFLKKDTDVFNKKHISTKLEGISCFTDTDSYSFSQCTVLNITKTERGKAPVVLYTNPESRKNIINGIQDNNNGVKSKFALTQIENYRAKYIANPDEKNGKYYTNEQHYQKFLHNFLCDTHTYSNEVLEKLRDRLNNISADYVLSLHLTYEINAVNAILLSRHLAELRDDMITSGSKSGYENFFNLAGHEVSYGVNVALKTQQFISQYQIQGNFDDIMPHIELILKETLAKDERNKNDKFPSLSKEQKSAIQTETELFSAGSSNIIYFQNTLANSENNKFFKTANSDVIAVSDKIKDFLFEKINQFTNLLQETVKSFLNLFRKNNADDKPDDTASPTGQGSNSDNGVSDSERKPETEQEESQEQMQENSGKFCYCMEYQIETYDFCQYEENNYSEIIESPKASAGIKAEISNEKWESMIPQRDIIQPNQEYQHSDRSDNQEQEEEYHEKENDSLDR